MQLWEVSEEQVEPSADIEHTVHIVPIPTSLLYHLPHRLCEKFAQGSDI